MRSKVHLINARDQAWAARELSSLLGLYLDVEKNDLVVIKPSIGSPLPAECGATTSLWIVDAVARYLIDKGARPVVVESPSHSQKFSKVMELTGYSAWSRKTGVELLDACRLELAEIRGTLESGEMLEVRVPKLVLDCRRLVLVSKLKTHDIAGATGCAKSLMGLLPYQDRRKFHRLGLDLPVKGLAKALFPKVGLALMDAVVAMEGNGPTMGEPVDLGLLFLSTDPGALDRVAFFDVAGLSRDRVLGLEHHGACGRAIIELHGLREVPRHEFKPADTGGRIAELAKMHPLVSGLTRLFDMGRKRIDQVVVEKKLCNCCNLCVEACPTRALDHPPSVDTGRCVGCRLCLKAGVCPEGAIRLERPMEKLARLGLGLFGRHPW